MRTLLAAPAALLLAAWAPSPLRAAGRPVAVAASAPERGLRLAMPAGTPAVMPLNGIPMTALSAPTPGLAAPAPTPLPTASVPAAAVPATAVPATAVPVTAVPATAVSAAPAAPKAAAPTPAAGLGAPASDQSHEGARAEAGVRFGEAAAPLSAAEAAPVPAANAPAAKIRRSRVAARDIWERQRRTRFHRVDSVTTYPSKKTEPFPALVKVISDPREGFLSKIMMIRNARSTIEMSTFIFKRDAVGYAILNELKAALERGVSVRLLVDSVGSMHFTHSELRALLSVRTSGRASAEVVLFNPLINVPVIWEMLRRKIVNLFTRRDDELGPIFRWRNRRLHDKILLVDRDDPERAIAIIGGRNIANKYYGLPKMAPDTFTDMELIVRNGAPSGESLKSTLGAHFDRLYFHLGNKVLLPNLLKSTQARQLRNYLRGKRAAFSRNAPIAAKLAAMEASRHLQDGFSATTARFVHEIQNLSRQKAFLDPENPVNRPNPDSIVGTLAELVSSAQKSIVFVSPYFFLEEDEIKRLQAWLDADPERTLTIIFNSIATTDNLPAQALADSVLPAGFLTNPNWSNARGQAKLLAFGRLDSQDLGGPVFYGQLHAKYAVIDGRVGLVSTSNGDPRSRTLNSEIGFTTYAEDSAGQDLAKAAVDLAARCYEWGSPEWTALRKKHRLKAAVAEVLAVYLRYFKISRRNI